VYAFFTQSEEQGNVNVVENVNLITNTNIVSNTNTIIDTSNWLTYKNDNQGYQINIPQDWTIEEVDDDGVRDNFKFPGPVRYTVFLWSK